MQDKSHTSGILDNKNAFNAVNHHAILFSSWRPIVFQLQSPAYINLFCRMYFGSFSSKDNLFREKAVCFSTGLCQRYPSMVFDPFHTFIRSLQRDHNRN